MPRPAQAACIAVHAYVCKMLINHHTREHSSPVERERGERGCIDHQKVHRSTQTNGSLASYSTVQDVCMYSPVLWCTVL